MPFIWTNNRNNFLIDEVKIYHPKSKVYIDYWKRHKKRCIEGFWSIDDSEVKVDLEKSDAEIQTIKSNKWRWMTPNLYFYVNFGIIMHKEEDGPKAASRKKIRPSLRDLEWEFFYNWIEARGFSGFEDDDEYTCNREVLNYSEQLSISPTFSKDCYKKDGTLKTYIPARQYLRSYFDRPMGRALYNNQAKNMTMLGSRGGGKSYWTAVGVCLWAILFDDAKVYDEESKKNPYKVEICVGASIAAKSSEMLQKAKECLENLPGAWMKDTPDEEPSPIKKRMSGSLAPNNVKNKWRHEYEKKIAGDWKTFGTGSYIAHVVYTIENPEAAAGGRYTVTIVEEQGLVENMLQIHGSNTATMVEGTDKFGSALYLGTGGNVEKVQEAEIIFRDPAGFDMLEFDDEWEGSGKIGWFIPSYYTLNQFKDSNGNTDVERALAYRTAIREEKKKAKSKSALDLEMMNYPIVPSEMFLNVKGNRFPVADIKAHLAEVKTKPHLYQNTHWIGDLRFVDGKLVWEKGDENELVKTWPIIDNSACPGVIEIFEMPKKDREGNVYQDRYIQGTDTYDDDESNTSSLGSTFILDLWTNRIVAEYTGRRLAKDFYEITRKLNIFYSAKHCYENNKKGLYVYYEQKKSIHLLSDTPETLRDVMDYTISRIGNKSKGVNMSGPVIAYAMRLLEQWLLEPAYNPDGEDDPNILNLHKIRSQGLLQELISYKPDGNFDRISAMLQVMILKEDLFKVTEKRKQRQVKSLSEDPFFERFKKPAVMRPDSLFGDENKNISNNTSQIFNRFGISNE
jgi:hypothetical protein